MKLVNLLMGILLVLCILQNVQSFSLFDIEIPSFFGKAHHPLNKVHQRPRVNRHHIRHSRDAEEESPVKKDILTEGVYNLSDLFSPNDIQLYHSYNGNNDNMMDNITIQYIGINRGDVQEDFFYYLRLDGTVTVKKSIKEGTKNNNKIL